MRVPLPSSEFDETEDLHISEVSPDHMILAAGHEVCVCVRERERERERGKWREGERGGIYNVHVGMVCVCVCVMSH